MKCLHCGSELQFANAPLALDYPVIELPNANVKLCTKCDIAYDVHFGKFIDVSYDKLNTTVRLDDDGLVRSVVIPNQYATMLAKDTLLSKYYADTTKGYDSYISIMIERDSPNPSYFIFAPQWAQTSKNADVSISYVNQMVTIVLMYIVTGVCAHTYAYAHWQWYTRVPSVLIFAAFVAFLYFTYAYAAAIMAFVVMHKHRMIYKDVQVLQIGRATNRKQMESMSQDALDTMVSARIAMLDLQESISHKSIACVDNLSAIRDSASDGEKHAMSELWNALCNSREIETQIIPLIKDVRTALLNVQSAPCDKRVQLNIMLNEKLFALNHYITLSRRASDTVLKLSSTGSNRKFMSK